eukprot:1112687_1
MNLLELVLMVLCIKTRIVGREIVNKIEMNMDDEFDVELSCECVRGLDCEWRDGGSAIRCDDGRVSSCAVCVVFLLFIILFPAHGGETARSLFRLATTTKKK